MSVDLDTSKDSRLARSFTFSARPDFIEEVKSVVKGPFSQAVVEGLKTVVQRVRSGEIQRIHIPQRIGSLTETLEFDGRWVVPPDRPLEYVPPVRTADESVETSDDPFTTAELEVNDLPARQWWAAALTRNRSFIWFCTHSVDGFQTGDLMYFVQSKADLHYVSFSIVPHEIYDAVRKEARPLLPPLRIAG